MATTETVEIDLGWVEELTKRETDALDRRHARSLTYREEAKRFLPGGVSSSWQSWPPHPIYVRRGEGSHVWDIDGNDYVDLHNGYGVMVMGHAHPKVVDADGSNAGRISPNPPRRRSRSPRTSPSATACRNGGSATPGPRPRWTLVGSRAPSPAGRRS